LTEGGDRYEIYWMVIGIVLLAITALATYPMVYTLGGSPNVTSDIPSNTSSNRVINTIINATQYTFMISESSESLKSITILPNGEILPYYYNLMVVHPGEYLNMTMYGVEGKSATESMYIPVYNSKYVVDTKILPGISQYAVWYSGTTNGSYLPYGAYTFLNSEYNGPWFSYQAGEILVIPESGYIPYSSLLSYISSTKVAQSSGLIGDPYNPPLYISNSTDPTFYLVSDDYALFNDSVPGPTFAVAENSTVTLKIYIPTPKGDHNWLYNYSSNGEPYAINNIYVGVYAVWWNGTITPVVYQLIKYDSPINFTFEARAPAYLYGIIYPSFYNFNPNNLSSSLLGEQKGYVMSLWGSVLVFEG